jgi:hypothetical protein
MGPSRGQIFWSSLAAGFAGIPHVLLCWMFGDCPLYFLFLMFCYLEYGWMLPVSTVSAFLSGTGTTASRSASSVRRFLQITYHEAKNVFEWVSCNVLARIGTVLLTKVMGTAVRLENIGRYWDEVMSRVTSLWMLFPMCVIGWLFRTIP